MTTGSQPILLGRGAADAFLLPAMANRHGLVSGATGTGKTVTLRVLAEDFSDLGVPVFLADIKGDLSGLAAAGGDAPTIVARARELGLDFTPAAYPAVFWDILGRDGPGRGQYPVCQGPHGRAQGLRRHALVAVGRTI